jgi:arylsulfatase A-like enzyme
MQNPRTILASISATLLIFLVYINIRAMQRDQGRKRFGAESDHNALYRILQQSISSSSASGGVRGAESDGILETDAFDESDNGRVKDLEEKIDGTKNFLGDLETRLREFVANAGVKSMDTTRTKQQLDASINKESQKQPDASANKESKKQSEPLPTQDPSTLTGYNILLLYADDWTHHTLSSFHKTQPLNTILKTPVLDALAQDGIRFTYNCVTTSVCWISRATLFTGQYMSRHNTTEPCCWGGMKKPKEKLEEAPSDWNELSVYEILKRNGYHVGHAGKWGVYMPWPKTLDFNVEDDGWHWRKIGDKLWHITEKNEADALRFLVTRPRDKPFFLNVAFFATHAKDSDARQYMPQNESMSMYAEDTIPIPPTGTDEAWKKMPWFFSERNEGRTRWRARFQNYTLHQSMMKNYYRMVSEVDAACGAILEELRRQDALDNTVIIFTTDNGNFHSEHGLADKWYPHQESIRTPLIIRDPRMKDELKGTTNDAFTLNIDLPPTILGAAGITPPEKYMGRDMSDLYLTSAYDRWRQEFFYEHPVVSKASYIPSSEALVRKNYKYMYWPDYDFEQLFDLVKDPGEIDDIFNSTDPEIRSVLNEMKRRFEELKVLVKSDEIVTL